MLYKVGAEEFVAENSQWYDRRERVLVANGLTGMRGRSLTGPRHGTCGAVAPVCRNLYTYGMQNTLKTEKESHIPQITQLTAVLPSRCMPGQHMVIAVRLGA